MERINADIFPAPLSECDTSDLEILNDVEEGWYIDYKSEGLSTKQLAKHVSSFANQYGGWLVFGAKEAQQCSGDSETGVGEFPGLGSGEVTGLKENLRNASRDCIEPEVYFETFEFEGPEGRFGLADDKTVIVVEIPRGDYPPYVTHRGKVYRRVADSSDPEFIRDRTALDRLWERRAIRKKFDALMAELVNLRQAASNKVVPEGQLDQTVSFEVLNVGVVDDLYADAAIYFEGREELRDKIDQIRRNARKIRALSEEARDLLASALANTGEMLEQRNKVLNRLCIDLTRLCDRAIKLAPGYESFEDEIS